MQRRKSELFWVVFSLFKTSIACVWKWSCKCTCTGFMQIFTERIPLRFVHGLIIVFSCEFVNTATCNFVLFNEWIEECLTVFVNIYTRMLTSVSIKHRKQNVQHSGWRLESIWIAHLYREILSKKCCLFFRRHFECWIPMLFDDRLGEYDSAAIYIWMGIRFV